VYPTPVVGMLGLLDDYRLMVRPALAPGRALYLLGETFAELGGSEYAEVILGKISGRPPGLDLEREAALVALLVEAARSDLLSSAHDCSDGGLAVALAESAFAGDCGFAVTVGGDLPPHVALFSESASRAVVSVEPARGGALEDLAGSHMVPFARLGETGGPRMVFDDLFEVGVARARDVYESAIPDLMGLRRRAG
jgi:phosphoribosylformylglycinamidine (FGAM) synthase-like enzyme